MNGDVNGDGIVDYSDMVALLASFGRSFSDPEYNAAADLDRDGVVDLADYQTLLSILGQGTTGTVVYTQPESGLVVFGRRFPFTNYGAKLVLLHELYLAGHMILGIEAGTDGEGRSTSMIYWAVAL